MLNKDREATDEELVRWATDYLRKDLTPCVEDVLLMARRKAAYRRAVRRRLYPKPREGASRDGALEGTFATVRGFRSAVEALVGQGPLLGGA